MGKAQQLETRSHRGSMLHVDSNSKCSKRRIRWTQELHQRFEHAVAALGGAAVATPKGILDHMKAPDVTIMHVKSHLQKYRLTLTADGSGQNRYSGSDEPVSLQDQPSRRRLSVEAQAEAQAGDEGLSVDHDALRLELGEVDDNTQVPTDAPQATCTDNAARKKLVDTVVQQHAMQEELKHQIRVQTELYRSLQNQHQLLQQHFMSQTFQQQQQQQLYNHCPMYMRTQEVFSHPR